MVFSITINVSAQTLQRFVKTSGSPANTGSSWSDALDNLQEAINSLHQEMMATGINQGAIYVAAGKYNPTESTEAQNSNILNTSFLIYDGITIYGGYPEDPQDGDDYDPANREMKPAVYNGNPATRGQEGDHGEVGPVPVNKWDFKYETKLSGNHTTGLETTFTFNAERAQYNTRFPSSSFHVIWFATKGAIDSESSPGHYQGLSTKAGIDGCIIEEGYASSRDLNGHNHMGFGGGVYMVKNSFLRNCIIRRCQASQRGGGVYMDGGGEVESCFIYECQTTGVAIAQGYGGAVCIDYNGSIKHSYLAQNTARIGGGLAICHVPGEYPTEMLSASERANSFSPFAAACVIANNSTNAEAGGVFLDEGGTINHCTVVKNNCIGPDITYYGRRHGRSGGIYVRNCGSIYNSVFWGNECKANNDMQFASIRQSSALETDAIDVYYSAFYNQDITDWSNVTKDQVYTLTAYNRPHRANSEKCCWFEVNYDLLSKHGTADWWNPDQSGSINNDLKAGVDYNETTLVPEAPQILTTWRPRHSSYLAMKGVQISSTFHIDSEWIRHAHVAADILGKTYETVSTLGAVAQRGETYKHTLVKQQGEEGRKDPSNMIPTIFVDGQRNNVRISSEDRYEDLGESWDYPAVYLADGVNYFEEHRIKDKTDPNFNKYKWDGDETYYPAVQILVKEGTVTTAGTGNYEANDIRTAAIRPTSNMRFYGGYPKTLDGVDVSERNPGQYITLLSSNIVGEYDNSSAHGFGIINAQNVIIDGVRMAYGNVVGMETTSIVKKGTGIILSNTTISAEDRIDMVGNELRNSVIANTQAYDGSAIYVNSVMPKEDNSIARTVLTVKNTVIRNCTTKYDESMGSGDGAGVIVANGNAQILLDHCTIVNNVGYPLKTQTGGGYTGEIVLTNSVLFANSRDQVNDRSDITRFSATLTGEPGTITGHHNMIDKLAPQDATLTAESTNQYILDVSSNSTNYPTFKNPSSNVGHSEGVDRPLYGGTVSYEPLNRNPIVNAADDASMTKRDRTDINFFNYGGASDLGAIENTNLPKNGTVLYVTPDGAGKRDGSSWANAIAGNTVYALNEVAGPPLASGDQLDAENNRVLDAAGNPVLTSDEKYCGGYGRSWFTQKKTGGSSSTTVTKTWIVEKNVWDDGERAGEEEYIRNDVTPTVTSVVDPGSESVIDDTFEAGWMYDPRYPYGEISGASRTFWRANTCVTAGNNNKTAFMNAVDANGWINNTHEEKYVSGLQYAVEKASTYNVLAENDPGRVAGVESVQVWISNGKYTDYKGYVMRDKTTVMGSFPAVKGGSIKTPGLAERHALMSNIVSIPKAKPAENLNPEDYETILQISDINPKNDEGYTFNTDAVKFYDNDLIMVEKSDTRTFEYKTRNIVHHYSMNAREDMAPSYIFKPKFEDIAFDKPSGSTDSEGYHYSNYGTKAAGYLWHLKYPNKENYVATVESNNNSDRKRDVYDPESNSKLTETDKIKWIFIGNGSLTDLEFWQTIPELPGGYYQLSVDMAGGYRNKYSSTDPTNIYFHIIDATGAECIEPVMLKTIGSSKNSDDANTSRGMAYRYLLSFSQPTSGPLTIKIKIEDGVRNTTTANPTYGTESGGDPDPIPSDYTTSYGGNNPNRREFWMSNLQLFSVDKDGYGLALTDDETVNKSDVPSAYYEEDGEVTSISSEVATSRTELRKRVLTMPDVTVPTYGPDRPESKYNDDICHTDRVPNGSVRDLRTAAELAKRSDSHYVAYTNVNWDGFTIRHGFLYGGYMAHGGGSGVNMYEGANLRNCVVINNVSASKAVKGGGLFCDGATSTIEGCFVLNNTSTQVTGVTQNQIFAGGMFMYEGTCFNSLFAKNYSYGTGGGLGFCVGRFYNNTVAYNTCDYTENSAKNGGALALATSSNPNLFIANTIIYGNNGRAIRERGDQIKMKDINPFIHCYVQSTVEQVQNYFTYHIGNHSDNSTYYGVGNVFYNGVEPSADNTPFLADLDEEGSYTGNAQTCNDFRIHTRNGASCVNTGTEEFAAKLEEALTYKKEAGNYTGNIKESYLYKNVEKVELPLNDVAFADRIQDCAIDIGAYEYNGSLDIQPDVTTFANQKLAVYYVTENGFQTGNASANSPWNAACYQKLQKVLDAAGRWKYKHAVTDRDEYADFIPVVALAGNTKDNQGNMGTFKYMPERSTKSDTNAEDNVIDYSLIIPHGVQLWGGFYEGTTSTPGFYEVDSETGKAKMLRDPLRYPTYITGDVTSSTGAEGQARHVIQFTNDLFDEDEEKIPASVGEGGQKTYGQLAALTDEKDRAVLDGLFIIHGYANGSPASNGGMTTDMNGAAAIVTRFAHVRNCVISDNKAMGYGGGLYLEPHALVSGCIIKDNEAVEGGGVYVAQPAADPSTGKVTVGEDTYAFLLTSTVVGNTASQLGGGLVFDSNLRANSCIFWHNNANDKNNVSGQQVQSGGESQSVTTTNYPMVYCGIEVVRWEGVNNLLVSANETEGVRWDHNNEYYETYNGKGGKNDESLFYPIEMSSVLSRAGMTYNNWEEYMAKFPTLEETDIAGMKRMVNETAEEVIYDDATAYIRKKKDNSLIEMGARVVNASFEVRIDEKHIMKRLYVVHTEDLNSDNARKLQDNGYVNDSSDPERQARAIMYSQMGSCFANPFHRLGDALEYVMNVRKSTQEVDTNDDGTPDTAIRDIYKDVRFEIFLTNGTFYPYRNAYGMQAASRSNTFVIPEMVSIIGGVDCDEPYGQEGYGETGTDDTQYNIEVMGESEISLRCMHTRTIRSGRKQSDLNMNNVVEPWELDNQSILSGNVISGTETKNAYHVITCYPDANKVGLLPTIKDDNDDELPMPSNTHDAGARDKYLNALRNESRESKVRRTIIIDGVTVTAGLANDISDEDKSVKYQQLTYFRGGGILVEGNWDQVDETGTYTPDVTGVANRDIPLLVTGCMFQDNMAANGGAIYTNGTLNVFGCHFAQNTSRGPNTDHDQDLIPWSAGGAIATNYDCTVVNTIFANNEAKRGTKSIKISPSNGGIDRADIRQGFGGVISASETSTVHAMNCDFVRNKAVAFPAIYNFLCQSEKSEKEGGNYKWERGDWHHWAVNSIFWGNEKNENVSAGGQVDSYAGDSRNDSQCRTLGSLFQAASGKTPRKREDVANFGINDRSEEVLYFCAYEQEYGLPSELMVKSDMMEDEYGNIVPSGVDVQGHKKTTIDSWEEFETGSWMEKEHYPDEWKETKNGKTTYYTHNQYLASDNNAISGPNFLQPSTLAGADGYMQNADWLVSRLNRIIDNGWSYLPQHVTNSKVDVEGEKVDAFKTIFKHTNETESEEPVLDNDGNPLLDKDGNQVMQTVYNIPDEMDNTTLAGSGIYNFYSLKLDDLYGSIGMSDLAPLGEHAYMKYDQFGESTAMSSTMRRISTYPKQGEQEVFVDIGVYEYQYVQLFIPGNAYDVIWVRPDNPTDGTIADGTTWERATNNVQQAIDMLMSSHNDHDKVLKMRAGDYSPVYLTHGKLSFYIEHDANPNSVLYPTATGVTDYLGVNSITIRGGYPNELTVIPDKTGDYDGENVRNPELYPTRFIMSGTTGYENKENVKDNLFIIQNMEMQEANRNFISSTELDRQGYAVPVSFEGLTFSNPYSVRQNEEDENQQGAAILYTQQHKYNDSEELLDPPMRKYKENGETEWKYAIDGRPKLLIKDCIFLDNGTRNADGTAISEGHHAPTVNIMGGGGNAIVANSLFHSNGGIPLEGYNTKVVNCSFALNYGQLTLMNNGEINQTITTPSEAVMNNGVTGSVMHNSIIWRDQLKDGKPYNFGSADMLGKNNAVWSAGLSDTADSNGNQALANNNTDILKGPNFTDPTPDDPWQRDMHPRPSDRIMSKGNWTSYKETVPYYNDVSSVIERSMKVGGETKTAVVQTVTRNLLPKTGDDAPTDNDWKDNETELAHMPRFLGKGLERGPYETVAAIQRVLYVDPIKEITSTNDGASWERAFGGGQLQNAIDAAGVYTATNGGQRSYVFVKGAESAVEPAILARDGVTVYGSVTNSLDGAKTKEIVDLDFTFKEVEIFDYINRVRAARSGMASTTITSKLRGLVANGETMSSGFVLDGFGITNGTDRLTSTPVVLNDDKTLMRNCIVYSNHIDGENIPVVNIKDGLLYNSLLYGNNATMVVNVAEGATGGVLNCTVVSESEGQIAVSAAEDDKVVNAITYNHAANAVSGTGTFVNSNTKPGMFAPYLKNGANAYNYPFGTQEPLWYQLHEDSECINGGTNSWETYFGSYDSLWEGLTGDATDGWVPDYSTKKAQKFIDFSQDRDILGNPRLLFTTVDRGAFETWRVADNAVNATEVTNETETTDDDADGRADCPVKNYGGHTYPHVGSVVYIGENASLLVKTGNFPSELSALVPGYLLLKKGASFYGQGNFIRVPYVATEHAFAANQQYALFSLPYDWDKANVISLSADGSHDALTQNNESSVITRQQSYNGSQRAQWGSSFHVTDSPYWESVDKGTANEGYLLTLNTANDLTLRFTAWGINESDAAVDIYTEDSSDKVVELTQHNSNAFAAGSDSPQFTSMEDMGWNLKGQPWLVHSFKTYATDANGDYDAASQDYSMNVPHLLYKNINAQSGENNTTGVATELLKHGQFISGRSWTDGTTLELGSAFLTQTAIMDDTEELTFKRPVYYGTKESFARQLVSIARRVGRSDQDVHENSNACDDVVEICPLEDAEADVSYQFGNDGLKWYAIDETLAHIYVPSTTGVKMSLVSKAPVEVEIPLGIIIPEAGDYTIALPKREAYAAYQGVWLTDHQTGTVTNLLDKNYTFTTNQCGDVNNRLTIKIGGKLPDGTNVHMPSVLKLVAKRGRLPLNRFGDDDYISIYSPSGSVVYSGTVRESRSFLLPDGVYVVKRHD